MKTINIHNVSDLFIEDFLGDKFANLEKLNKNSISIQLNSESDLSELSLRLAIYTVSFVEEKILTRLKEYLIKRQFNEDTFNQIQNTDFKYIYTPTLIILYKEYLKDNVELDLESFITFNCRGLERDFFILSKEYLQIYEEELEYNSSPIKTSLGQSITEETYEDVSSIQKYYSYLKEVDGIICKFKDEATRNNIDYKKIDTVHVKIHKEKMILTDSNNRPLENYLEENLSSDIISKLKNNDSALKTTVLILICISIFKTSTIIFHQSIPKKSLSRILLFLYDSKEINPELQSTNLIKCSGCNSCYLN